MGKTLCYIVGLILLLLGTTKCVNGQNVDTVHAHNRIYMNIAIVEGDTIPAGNIREIIVYPKLKFRRRMSRKYAKLVRDLKVVYPYAQKAKNKLYDMEMEFRQLESEAERKQYIKNVEKELKEEFKEDVKHLTINQGRLLLKLIDRETGDTSYQLLQELKGNFSAGFWQTIARIFGHDLKAEYEPHGRDRLIERIVVLIEHDQI